MWTEEVHTQIKAFQELCNYWVTHSLHQNSPRTPLWGSHPNTGASLVAQMVKNLPAMQETQVWSLGQKDPLEKGMGTPSRVLAWRSPWAEETGGLSSMGSQRVGHALVTNTHTQHRYQWWNSNPTGISQSTTKGLRCHHQPSSRREIVFVIQPSGPC